MSTTAKIKPITPKYDEHYNVEHTIQGFRLIGEILGELAKEGHVPDVANTIEMIENSTDLLLYTLGWLEPLKKVAQTNIKNAACELAKGIELLVKQSDPTRPNKYNLGDIASTYLEFANSLEEFARHAVVAPEDRPS